MQVGRDRYYALVSPWQDQYGLNWLVVVTVPESDFMAQINANTRTTLWLCLGALAIATTLGIYTSRWIVRPILKLQEASEAITTGELDRTVELGGINELRGLGSCVKIKPQWDALTCQPPKSPNSGGLPNLSKSPRIGGFRGLES